MLKSLTKISGWLVFAALLIAAGELSVSVAGAGPAGSKAAPGDLLSDGYDALGADRPDLARKIFQTLLNAYPESNEAATAADELAAIDEDKEADTDAAARASDPRPAPTTAPSARRSNAAQAARPRLASQPAEQLRRLRLRFLTDVGDRVFFAENSDALGGRAKAIVEAQGRWLKDAGNIEITIIGRAADGGGASDNQALSLSRARAVEAKLIEAGVDPKRIKIDARGNADPVATCTSAQCEAQNRHAESYLRYPGTGAAQVPLARSQAIAGGEPADIQPRTISAR